MCFGHNLTGIIINIHMISNHNKSYIKQYCGYDLW